ncbi:hypothetical protein [Pseudoalteromonas rubra]|uniref:Fibronectin type-III domain-containing protein n=1 Tax=Pseudoalteromonas rubra TaxID=43658 RepID=A0A0U2P4A6_9GAMM|nr:hypothetical protein [Pseudoalteromonas rubra]ALU41949.1 hypothetical protein AT705_02785 [Pseudoalteromonas rubra]
MWADDLIPGAVDITPNSDYVAGKPGAVFDVRVAVDGDGNGLIKWAHPTPLAVHEYDVEFYLGSTLVYQDAVTYTQMTVPTLALGTYTARVYARNIFGQRSTSVAVQFSVLQPYAPQVSVEVDYNQVTLTASLPAIGIGTRFQWEFLGTAESPASGQRVFAQVYNRIGLQPLTTYQFRVRAVNHLGNSDWVNVSATTTTVDLTEFINEIPLQKLSQEAQDLIADINQQVDRLRPETNNNLPSLVAKNIDQIQGLQDVTATLDDSLANGLPNQVRLANIKLDETALALTDMQRSVFDVTGNYTSFRQEYERRALANERLIDAIVYVDPDNGTIVNRAYQYTDSQFTLAQAHIDGVDARVSFEARRIKQTQDQLTEATAQIVVQAGLINQRATYTEVDAQIAGAIAALTPAYSWQFNTSDEGFTGHSSHNALGYVVCGNILTSPAIGYSGNQNPVFRLRVRKHANSTWLGLIHFGGAQPIPLPEPTSTDWEVVQVDATGTAGYAGTITGLTFELGACDVDYIEVGKRGANDLALRDVTARTSTIEQELDAGTGRMAQYATTAWTNAQGYQTQSNVQAALDSFNTTYGISAVLQQLADNDVIVKANAAQTWIDGANATIKNQVTQLLNEDGGVNQKLATAEQQLDAIAGEISQTVTQVQGLQLDLADKTLNEVLSEYNTLLRNNELAELGVTLAHANSKLSAVTDDVRAVAEQTTQLIAMQNQSAAGVTALGRAYANERQASAEREQRLRAEITTESGKAVAQAIDFTRAVTGYCVDANGNQVDEQDAVSCEAAGHTWIDGPVVERSMMLATVMVDNRGYQTSNQVSTAINTFNGEYGITAALQTLTDNNTLVKANHAASWIAAADGYIRDQITIYNNTDGGINDQFAHVDQTLDAIAGEISRNIVQIHGAQLADQAQSLNDVIAAYNQLMQGNDLAQQDVKLALAQDKLSAVTDELESTASYTLELGALHHQSQAYITTLASAFASEVRASVTRDERFAAFVGDTQAAFSDVTEAFAEVDAANIIRDQAFSAFAANTEAAFQTVTETLASQEQALARQRTDLVAKIEQDDTATLASAITYTRVAVGYCIDAAGNITNETDAVQCVTDGHSWVDGPLAEYIRNLAITNADGQAVSIADIRQAFETQDGQLVARGGWVINNQGRIVSIAGYNDGDVGSIDLSADVIRQGVMIGDTFVPTSYVDNTDPDNPVHVFRGRLELGDYTVNSVDDIRAQDGERGPQGVPGEPGADGQTTYTWIKYAEGPTGSGMSDSPAGRDYIGFAYNKTTPVESTNPADYIWSKLRGEPGADGQDGTDGVPGEPGADGQTLYTWIAYSDYPHGADMYQTPSAATLYIGIAVNKTTATESNNPSDYTWSRFRGNQGVPGQPGADGKTTYTWIKYAQSITGSGMSDYPGGLDYIGFAYNKLTPVESSNPSDYTWSKLRGEPGTDGTDGIPGEPGADGQSLYTWIAYSDYADGRSMYQIPTDQTLYIGIAVNKTTSTESANPADYTWSLFKGPQGEPGLPGVPGEPGADGRTTYTWIKYAQSMTGSGMSDYPDGRDYIGFAYNKTTPVESTNPADYIWSKLRGEPGADGQDGTDGVPGEPGADGQSLYTWIAYSDYYDGRNMYQVPNSTTNYIGISVNKTTATESSNPADYTWSRFRGDRGQDGRDGQDGVRGPAGSTGSRGPGQYTIGTLSGAWSDAVAVGVCDGSPVRNDVVTIYKVSDPKTQTTKYWSGVSWLSFTLHIHGSALVDGTVFADGLVAATGTIDSITAVSGYVTINNDGISARRISSYARFVTTPGQTAADNPATVRINGNSGTVGNLFIYNPSSSGYGATIYTNGTYALYASRGLIGPFTGGHDGLVAKSVHLEPGDLVRDIDLVNIADLSNAICTMGPTTKANDRAVRGVFITRTALTSRVAALRGYRGFERFIEYRDTHDAISFNALGEGVLNVCGQGGDIDTGDYLCSSAIRGKAMRQADQEFERPYTIAQARHPITFTHPDQVKQAAVIYLRG